MKAKEVNVPSSTFGVAKRLTERQRAVVVKIKKGSQNIQTTTKNLFDRRGQQSQRFYCKIMFIILMDDFKVE